MAMLKAFSNTTVSLFKTQDDLEKLLAKHGIKASRWTHFADTNTEPGIIRFEFQRQREKDGPQIGYRVDVSYKYVAGPRGGNQGTTREQAGRALFWHVKNLFDAVEFGIVDMEQAFFPYMLTAGDQTVYDAITPQIEALQSGSYVPLLTAGRE